MYNSFFINLNRFPKQNIPARFQQSISYLDQTKLFLIITLFGVISAGPNPYWCPFNGLIAQSDETCLVAWHDGTKISHVDAASRCRSYSSYQNEYQLPTVKTPQKYLEVQSWLSSHPMHPRSGWLIGVWLNLEREFTQSKDLSVWRRRTDLRWRDGDSGISDALSETMWNMWREGEPNNNFQGSNEYCVFMVLFDHEQKEKPFYDAPCGEKLLIPSMILCEKKPPLTTTTLTSTTTSTASTSTTSTTTTTTLPLTTTTQLSTSTSSASTSAFFPNATLSATQLIADPYLGKSTNCTCTCTYATLKFPFITSPPGTATIAVLVILYVLGAVIFSVGLYLFISAKRRIRKARKEDGAKMQSFGE